MYQEPKQLIAVDRMKKRGFTIDYQSKAYIYMSGLVRGLKRYVTVDVNGLVNGRPAMMFR
jgi:hypothetical protein